MGTGAPLLQSPQTVGIAGHLAIGPMFAAHLLYGIGLRRVRSTVATTVTLLEPLVNYAVVIIVLMFLACAVFGTALNHVVIERAEQR